MADFGVIIPAAGASTRFQGFSSKKPFVELKGRPIWLRTVEHFVNRPDVSEVVLVLAADDVDEFRQRFKANLAFLSLTIVTGGATRAESVRNGLRALQKPCDFVAVHDAARPLLTKAWVNQIFSAAEARHAVIPAVPVSSTVKSVAEDGRILKTVDRTTLMLAQTPQIFRRTLLETAYEQVAAAEEFTDEASLVEASGVPVYAVNAWPMNIKITTKDDFHMAEALLAALPNEGGLASLL
ncbi:MAG: 2-C-methyl-D-erythritol 4-phosphate cytidylyltransferase [Planctomycetaceae bacterium]